MTGLVRHACTRAASSRLRARTLTALLFRVKNRTPIFVLGLLLSRACVATAAEPAQGTEFFEKRIRPLLANVCADCHGAEKQKGDLRLDSRAGWMRGGASGAVIVPGKPDDSLLITAVRYWDKSLQMPPKHPLEPAEVNDLIEWVKFGAPDPRTEEPKAEKAKTATTIDFEKGRKHWAFQPVKMPALPSVKDKAWARNDVDLFTLSRMEAAGVKPAPDADRRTLLRRVTFDLTGLPPTPEEVAAFESESIRNPQSAIRNVIDRLLASPRYGERWGRHWLDVVRYADTCGNASDYPVPQAFRYRNYVLQSFNDDVPFDQFVREQLAGDLLESAAEDERQRRIIATGYLANVRHFAGGKGEPHLTIEDAIENMGRAFLGLSINCARCHDHKFDPISSHDYYALYGILGSTTFPHPGGEGKSRPEDLVPLAPKAEVEAANKASAGQLAALDAEAKAAGEAKAAAQKEPASPEQKSKLDAATKLATEIAEKRKRLEVTPAYPLAYSVSEGASANARLQVRGDPKRLGEEIPRGFLQILGGQALPKDAKSSGRLELAQWITDPANPLTARVIVNRIWQHHFGRGLVATPNDFSTRGQPPSHPELLDFLARRFVESGWSVKAMHRLLLLSHTWQLAANAEGGARNAETDAADTSSVAADVGRRADQTRNSEPTSQAGAKIQNSKFNTQNSADPDNRLFAHAERRRLDAESIRDTMLFVCGDLDFTPGGEHPFPPVQTWSFTQHKQFFALYDTNQRAVYQMQQRLRKHPFLALFDGADTNSSTAIRTTSTTALQSLFAMNDPFVHERAARFAARLAATEPDEQRRIALAFLTLYARPPEPDEAAIFAGHLARLRGEKKLPPEQAWASVARVLIGANEFLFLD